MESSTQPLEPTTTVPMKPQDSAWPFISYVLVLYFMQGVLTASLDDVRSELPMVVLAGVIYGQIALAMVVGGLMGSTWLEGVFLSTIGVLFGTGIGVVASGSDIQPKEMLHSSIMPLICLIGAFPLIVFRWTVGWRLCPETSVNPPRSRVTIEDLILVPASLVAFWVMGLAPTIAVPGDVVWASTMTPFVLLLVICLLVVLPCTYWAFRIQDVGFRWVLCMGYPFALSIVLIVVVAVLGNGIPGEDVGWIIFGAILSSGVAMLGLQLLYAGGYRLVNSKRVVGPTLKPELNEPQEKATEPSPFDLEPVATAPSLSGNPQDSIRIRHRIAVAGLLLATAVVNTGTWAYSQREQKLKLERVVAAGGVIELANGKPIKISFGPATTAYELDQFRNIPTVTSISIAGTNITSFYLRNNFNSLASLDIRKTKLTPDSLRLRPSIEIIVNEGQFTVAELQDFKRKGLIVKQVAD